MKYAAKGIALGITLVVLHKLCYGLFGDLSAPVMDIGSAILFFLVVTAFLVSKKVEHLLTCGFCGLFIMFFTEIFTLSYTEDFFRPSGRWLVIYVAGFFGSMAALVVSCVLTAKGTGLSDLILKEGKTVTHEFTKDIKIKLLLYAVISAVSFSYLVLPQRAGISVPIFVLVQLACLWFLVPEKKRLLFLIPIGIMSLNCFISASSIWRTSNLIISAILYSCMFIRFDCKSDSLKYLLSVAKRIVRPFTCFLLPVKWALEINHDKAPVIKRIALALAVALPCVLLLTLVLSSADMVFSEKAGGFFSGLVASLQAHTLWLLLCGILAGLYLFGVLCCSRIYPETEPSTEEPRHKGDLIIINILLCAILLVYTLFVIIQFKYLFAGSALPAGLTYTEYARKGFFELLALTGVNIAVILTVIRLTKTQKGKWALFTKGLCHYLCAVTVVLLVSSFYRMLLYTGDDGLTRLRFFVLGFLVFEAIGLLITFWYIAKQNINITLIYAALALAYYTLLNLVPADYIIAKNQIDKYLAGEREDLAYVFTLSADAAPAVEALLDTVTDEKIKVRAQIYLNRSVRSAIPERWQRYNLSAERAKKIATRAKAGLS